MDNECILGMPDGIVSVKQELVEGDVLVKEEIDVNMEITSEANVDANCFFNPSVKTEQDLSPNVSSLTFQDCVEGHHELLKDSNTSISRNSRTEIKFLLKKVEKDIVIWMNQEQEKSDSQLSFHMIAKKAEELYKVSKCNDPLLPTVNFTQFTASREWLKGIRLRHLQRIEQETIKELSINHKASAMVTGKPNIEAAEEYVRNMQSTFDQYSRHALFIAHKTYVPIEGGLAKQSGVSKGNANICFIQCANISNDFELRLACILRSNQCMFTSEELESMPLWFAITDSGEINETVLDQWINKEFSPKVTLYLERKGLPTKVLLLLPHYFSHIQKSFKESFSPLETEVLFPPTDENNLLSDSCDGCLLVSESAASLSEKNVSSEVHKAHEQKNLNAVSSKRPLSSKSKEIIESISKKSNSQSMLTEFFKKGN